jgi:hypothetical protein
MRYYAETLEIKGGYFLMDNKRHQLEAVPIDWKRCLEIVNGSELLAGELLAMFVKELPAFGTAFQEALQGYNLLELRKLSHRLKGLISYCVVPRVEVMLQYLDEAVKLGNKREVESIIECLIQEMNVVLEYYNVDIKSEKDGAQ